MTSTVPEKTLDLQRAASLRLAVVGETMFPPRAPFFRDRLRARAAVIAAHAEEKEGGNLTVSPYAPSLALEVR